MHNRKIRVLQLIEGFNLGGAEKKLWELIDHLDKNKFRITVCSFGMGDEIRGYFEKLNVKMIVLPRHHRIDISLIWRLARVIRHEKIDIVMTTLFYADILGAIVGKAAGAKGVFSWETISSPEWLIARRLFPYRLFIRMADSVISVSEATRTWLIEKRGVSPYHIKVIPYGVNLAFFHTNSAAKIKENFGFSQTDKIIGMVGRLHPQKGHQYLIEAAKIVTSRIPNSKFAIVGDGPLRHELERHAQSAGLENHFHFMGFRHDVPELIQIFDIFTLPSLYEGLPNVVLEAMACGLAVVATPVDGTKEAVIHNETGLLIPPENSEALANALIDLLINPEKAKRFGQEGRKRVENYFSLEKQVQQFEELYQEAAATN